LQYKGKQSKETHDAFLASLIGSGYEGVPIDPMVFRTCVALDGYKYGRHTENALKQIPYMEFGMFDVLTAGLSKIYQENVIDPESKKILLEAIIVGIGGRNWSRDKRTIFLNKVDNSNSLSHEDKELFEKVVELVTQRENGGKL